MDNIDNSLSFLKDLVKTYNKNIYQIVNHKIKDEYNENHREFQKIRRGVMLNLTFYMIGELNLV